MVLPSLPFRLTLLALLLLAGACRAQDATTRAQLRITLQNQQKQPLGQKVKVHLFNNAGAAVGSTSAESTSGAWTDTNGAVTFDSIPAGRYDLWLEPPGESTLDTPPGRIFHGLAVTAGADIQDIALEVPPAAMVKGRLLLDDGQTPAAGYVIAVQSGTRPDENLADANLAGAAGYARGAHECYAQTTVAADGSFTLSGLTPGWHDLDVRRPDEAAAWFTLYGVGARAGQESDIGLNTVPLQGWQSLFDGRTLGEWKESEFAGRAEVLIENGQLLLPMGNDMTGVTWSGEVPKIDYEVSFDARRVLGGDFFCGLTFPVLESPLTLIAGGWGGTIVGLSNIDGYAAVENETTKIRRFENGQWYRFRLRVTRPQVEAWIDQDQVVELPLEGRKLSIRSEVKPSLPFGFATWRTTGALRDIRLRRLNNEK